MAYKIVKSRDTEFCKHEDIKELYKTDFEPVEDFAALPNYQIVECPAKCGKRRVLWGGQWGGEYTDTSNVCAMALHMGITTWETGGTFVVVRKPCRPTYKGSTRNGITSGDHDAAPGSAEARKLDFCNEEGKCPQFSKCEDGYICVPAIDGAVCHGYHCENNKCVGTDCSFVDVLSKGSYNLYSILVQDSLLRYFPMIEM